jgi:hypothetical protein
MRCCSHSLKEMHFIGFYLGILVWSKYSSFLLSRCVFVASACCYVYCVDKFQIKLLNGDVHYMSLK